MKDIIIVIGANFGDEGKGLATDYFSKKENSIVVCSNGGSQRGHTVVTDSGIRHVFHHFGSGTFNGASTYLSKDFIVNPILFKQEYMELEKKGYKPKVYIHNNCMVTNPLDMMANQIIEESRGKNKHGSCGLGIYETIKRYESGEKKIINVNRDYYLEKFDKLSIKLSNEWRKLFFDDNILSHYEDDFSFMFENSLIVIDDNFLNEYDNIIFEQGQGLLLDQNNTDYFPHLTPSNTGITNPKEIIKNVKWNNEININTCYVTRTYLTRHGAGFLPRECNKNAINKDMYDKTNIPNAHQDTLRYGILDIGELFQKCSYDVGNFGNKKSIMITHCNECGLKEDDIRKLAELFVGWNVYLSDSEKSKDIELL